MFFIFFCMEREGEGVFPDRSISPAKKTPSPENRTDRRRCRSLPLLARQRFGNLTVSCMILFF